MHLAYDRRMADDDADVGELDIADYIVFLFALDTYMRWLEEAEELPVELVPEGDLPAVMRRGLMLLRAADSRVFGALEKLLRENLTNRGSLQMLDVVMRQPPTARGAGIRALRLRTIISRGGTTTVKAVFGKSSRARKQVLVAVEAAMLEDADAALNKFAAITLRNKRLEAWIDFASDTAVPLVVQPTNPIQEASRAAADQVSQTRTQTMLQAGEAPASDQAHTNGDLQQAALDSVEQTARDAARKSIERSGGEDAPVTRSEAIAIATAANAAAGTDPGDLKNLPPAFINGDFPLDAEQQAAALTDGRVLVAAGAGSGKTTTMVSRIAYLVQEKDVRPSRILACSFNRKAANELQSKVASKVGRTMTDQMSIGTMHSLFLRFIRGDSRAGIPAFGTPDEQALFEPRRLIADSEPGKPPKPGPKPINMTKTIQALFKECAEDMPDRTGLPAEWFDEIPKAKKCNLYVNVWKGNDVDVAEAKVVARTRAEKIAAVWYEFYMGLKGDLKGWKPPCSSKAADKWWDDYRPGGERLGDLDDQLRIFRDILVREPEARKRIQGMFDHIMVDEAQDRNTIQAQIFELMSEHITDGKDGKSIWIVGDDKQAIYQFRGAKPEIFSDLDDKEGWVTRMIRTNYRCEPEIVEAANKLAAHNEGQIPMEARANPKKSRGRASVRVSVPGDHAEGAIDTISRIVRETTDPPLGQGTSLPEYAVLTRTNAELNDFETACVLAETPYARTGGRGLFDSPESRAVLGYIDLAYGSDYDRMAKSLSDALTKPERGLYLGQDKVAKIVQETFEDVARMQGVDTKSVNPVDLITQTQFARQLALNLKMPYKAKIPDFVFRKTVDLLTRNILEMGKQVMMLRRMANEEGVAGAADVLNHVLDNVKATVTSWDKIERREVAVTKSLRDQISEDLALYADDDEDEEEESDTPEMETTPEGDVVPVVKEPNPAKGLGAVQFLFMMAEPNRRDAEEGTDPETAGGFIKKLTRIRKDSDKLRVNLQAWAKEQASKPEAEREKRPNCVILSTIHCSPPDEPVLTVDGWVPIADLDPARHTLASYMKSCNQLLWGKHPWDNTKKPFGYGFIKDTRPYSGTLVTLSTGRSRTRVTAEHRILARFSEAFMDKHVVYLMRRGEWWRVGTCVSARRPYRGAGVGGRLGTELANAGWILGVFDTKEEAMAEELRVQARYGVPGFTFEAAKGRTLTSAQLHSIHEGVKAVVAPRVRALLQDFGLDVKHPLYVRGEKERKNNFQKAFVLHACNVLSGYMDVPVASGAFIEREGTKTDWTKPEWLPVTMVREPYEGPVYSLTVIPHRFYVSGGAIVHNSVKGAEWRDTTVVMAPGIFPRARRVAPGEEPPTEEELAAELKADRNLAYVALTRAEQNLTILCPPTGKHSGLSKFVVEAGLQVGENVEKPAGVPPVAEVRTAASLSGLDLDYIRSMAGISEYSYGR